MVGQVALERVFYKNFGLRYEGRGGAVGCGTALQAGRLQVRFPMVSLDIILPVALWPWVQLSL
jgi:hypothetical protein